MQPPSELQKTHCAEKTYWIFFQRGISTFTTGNQQSDGNKIVTKRNESQLKICLKIFLLLNLADWDNSQLRKKTRLGTVQQFPA